MKKKRKIILIILAILLFISIIVGLFLYFKNPNRLTSTEKRFLADNSTNVQNINVLNDVNVFGNNGEGVFYDFIKSFSEKYSIKTNDVTYNLGETTNGVSFTAGNTVLDNESIFYQSHYVLIGKKNEFISSSLHLKNQKIGVMNTDLSYVTKYLNTENINLQSYTSKEELLKSFEEQTSIQYILVPLHLYIDEILTKDYYIVSHFEDIPYYFKINMGNNTSLGSIMQKYFATWKKEELIDSYREHSFKLFVKALNISIAEIDTLRSVTYQYGFVDNHPYEILSGGNYGGIIAQYLKDFTEFSDTEIHFTKYKNVNKFNNALSQNKIDLYFGYYDINNSFITVPSNISLSYTVLAPKDNNIVVESLKSLTNQTIYVLENSNLYTYLKNNSQAQIKTYKDEKELKKIVNKKQIVVMDSNTYYSCGYLFGKYNTRYSDKVDASYSFKLSTNEVFAKLFTKFVNIKSPNESIYKGIYNYDLTLRTGTITGTIARYFMYILIAAILIFLYVYRLTKKVKISKKIKKEDKLKYIDQLTSLKNRNYLTENLDNWSQNTIYPQAVVVIDLNNLQYINDTMGYEKGDEQIKATANILVKTQLDNSDIIRTDGNEFVVYLVGYQTKQVTSYMHKLNKEFKKLPYEYGAAIGYSMIEDKLKSVEDAINEAVEEVKKQKSNKKEE